MFAVFPRNIIFISNSITSRMGWVNFLVKAMLAAAVLLYGSAVRRVRGGIHLGSGSGRIGIVYVRHGSLVAKMHFCFPARRHGKAT